MLLPECLKIKGNSGWMEHKCLAINVRYILTSENLVCEDQTFLEKNQIRTQIENKTNENSTNLIGQFMN